MDNSLTWTVEELNMITPVCKQVSGDGKATMIMYRDGSYYGIEKVYRESGDRCFYQLCHGSAKISWCDNLADVFIEAGKDYIRADFRGRIREITGY